MRKILWILLVLILLGASIAYYLYNKPHRDIVSEEAEIELSAADLSASYEKNTEQANNLYLDKVVKVTGNVTEYDEYAIVLDDVIYCSMDSSSVKGEPSSGMPAMIKGRVIGYDDLFGQVKLDNCVVEP